MFKLVQISDPHLGPLPDVKPMQLASKRVLGYINWQRNRAHSMTNHYLDALVEDIHASAPDHIALCGDLVNIALPHEIESAKAWLSTLGNPEDVSVTPGNHDAYVPGALKAATTEWRPYMSSDAAADKLASDPVQFPFQRRRGPVGIVGVNTARATGPFMATGHMEVKQLLALGEALDSMAKQGLFRVVVMHHPPVREATKWHKRLVGSSRFRKVIAEHGAELILHGHTHYATRMTIQGPCGPVPVICVPSASNGLGHKKPPSRYNTFEISGTSGDWRCKMHERGFKDGARGIIDIATNELEIPQGLAAMA
ncbi:metallophosphoesterase [Pseudovibrio exalbescens]|uniref:metallophosphoesterase family protein n=1 Tax=Pseudovibrio exalbescens TaxID=197461 RepID=UPI0023669E9B|nr:metallophosphoesterase [Pseudovibrio exalbescens]MDD7910155.1 metallophosphoesterase [Pseudovibrio exalbescens]